MDADDLRLDGNAAAGLLAEVFVAEMTAAAAACAGCGATRPVGALVAYAHGMGAILRCPACDQAVIRIARGGGRLWLDLRGMAWLELDARQAASAAPAPPG